MQPTESTPPSTNPPPDPAQTGQVIQPTVSPVNPPAEIASTNFSAPNPTPSTEIPDLAVPINEPKKRNKKKLIIAGAATLVALLGGSAAAYFGYFVPNKPANVWRTALTNTGKGYDKLSEYAISKKNVKSMSAKGSFKITGDVASDGIFSGVSDGKSAQLTGSTSALGLKINYDVRAIDSAGNTPDIYFKVDGVQGLGDLVGGFTGELGIDNSQIKSTLNGLNGQWYLIDHSLFDQLASSSNSSLQVNSGDVDEVLKAIGNANKQYLFTNDTSKMAVELKQYIGKEKQDNLNVYHYKVGINKNNLTAYNKSLCENLAKTKLFKTFTGNSDSRGDVDLIKECEDNTGLSKIDTSSTADTWVDGHTKLIHKIRFSEKNNAGNYIDVGQNYQGGDEFPFSIATHSQESIDGSINVKSDSTAKPNVTTGLINMKLNTKTNTFTLDANFEESGSSSNKGNFKLSITPSNNTVKVETPANSKTIIQLINDLGFGSFTGGDVSGSQLKAKDAKRQSDVNALRSQLEAYFSENGAYPTLANMNDANWRKSNMASLDPDALKDPDGSASQLVDKPQAKAYAYQPTPAGCKNEACTGYTVTATLSDGTAYARESLQ